MPNAPREIKANVPFRDLDADDTKNALYNLLDKSESGGTFATSGVYAEAPLPGLSVNGFGEIPLPLIKRDACAIIEKQAAIEKGKSSLSINTPLDCSAEECVRKILELCRDTAPSMGNRHRSGENWQYCYLAQVRKKRGGQGQWGAWHEDRAWRFGLSLPWAALVWEGRFGRVPQTVNLPI